MIRSTIVTSMTSRLNNSVNVKLRPNKTNIPRDITTWRDISIPISLIITGIGGRTYSNILYLNYTL